MEDNQRSNCLSKNVQPFLNCVLADFFDFVGGGSSVYPQMFVGLETRPILVHNVDCGVGADLLRQKVDYLETARNLIGQHEMPY